MKKPRAMDTKTRIQHWIRMGLFSFGVCLAGIIILLPGCQSVERTIVAPPHIAGAEFSGSENCEVCHAEIAEGFVDSDHARLDVKGEHGSGIACESCHGPASEHIMAGGGRVGIINPRRSPETCLECHLDIKSKSHLPNQHPMAQGHLSCVDCHEPHHGNVKNRNGEFLASMTMGGQCGECHPRQAGPFAFEHEALREGCTTCHDPHGSVNAKLLKQRNASLCTQCHILQRMPAGEIMIGGENHLSWLSRGTCWTAGCHEAVHGSHITSTLRY